MIFYRLYHDKLVVSQSHVDALLENVSATINLLSSLSTSFKAVQEQTSAFQAQSQEILVEEQRASKLADDIKENLSYYDLLDPISRKLNAPGAGQLVREKEFSETLRQLDGCLQYMESHVSFLRLSSPKEADGRGSLITANLKHIVLDIVSS